MIVTVGGKKGTATYGDKGQRMIRANIGNAGVNQVKAGKAKVGQSYGATLGGVKGSVKYDAKGNRTFQALQNKPKPTTVKTKTGNKPLISGGKNVFDGTPG